LQRNLLAPAGLAFLACGTRISTGRSVGPALQGRTKRVTRPAGSAAAQEADDRRVGTGLPARSRRIPGWGSAALSRFADAGRCVGQALRYADSVPPCAGVRLSNQRACDEPGCRRTGLRSPAVRPVARAESPPQPQTLLFLRQLRRHATVPAVITCQAADRAGVRASRIRGLVRQMWRPVLVPDWAPAVLPPQTLNARALMLCISFFCEGTSCGPFLLTGLLCISLPLWPATIYISTNPGAAILGAYQARVGTSKIWSRLS